MEEKSVGFFTIFGTGIGRSFPVACPDWTSAREEKARHALKAWRLIYGSLPLNLSLGAQGLGNGVGRGAGVGRGLGVGVHLPVHGVAVGVGVAVAVAVGVPVGVAVGVAVTVGVGVGVEPACAQYLPPVLVKPTQTSVVIQPPQTIISLSVHTAV